MELIEKAAVLKILNDLWDQADEVEADTGDAPTAKEALDQALILAEGIPTNIS